MVATRVVRVEAQEQVRLRGQFRATEQPDFAIATVAISTSETTAFRLENAEPPGDRITREEFFSLAPDQIVFVEPRGLPKTSSGKLQRRLALRLFQAGELPVLEGTN